MKKILVAAAAIALFMTMPVLTSCTDNLDSPVMPGTNPDDLKPYTVKLLPVNRDGQSDGTVAIRFYEDMPSVPYISVSDFQSLVLPGSTVNVIKTGTGTYKLMNPFSTATVNTVDETFVIADYLAFTNLMDLTQPGMDNAYLDGLLPCVRYSYQTLTGGSPAVTFNYSKYGINLRGDEANVYFPFTTLADVYADLHYHNAFCNGEKVLVASVDDDEEGIGAFDPDLAIEKLMEKETRPADLVTYAYNELCFTIDHFYCMQGRSPYEASIRQNGIDQTLEASDDGRIIKQLLLSDKMEEYVIGLEFLLIYVADGGHTYTWNDIYSVVDRVDDPSSKPYYSVYQRYIDEYFRYRVAEGDRYWYMVNHRKEVYGDDLTYHKKGNTAIWHFDFFVGDALEMFLDALKKANDDPEVKNLVIDLTLNCGGSPDVLVAMTSLMYGESIFRCVNTLTGQQTTWYYDVDRNFDGKFDEKDKDVHYDLNFCLLTSEFSFSCGNLFPSLCKDAGLLVAGQQCKGGGCAIVTYRTAEGFRYQLSSVRCCNADKQWQNIDAGIVPNVLIEPGIGPSFDVYGKTCFQPDFDAFYDLDNLSQIVDAYYGH